MLDESSQVKSSKVQICYLHNTANLLKLPRHYCQTSPGFSSFQISRACSAFDTVGWVAEEHVACKNMIDVVLAWLSVWSDVQMICICST